MRILRIMARRGVFQILVLLTGGARVLATARRLNAVVRLYPRMKFDDQNRSSTVAAISTVVLAWKVTGTGACPTVAQLGHHTRSMTGAAISIAQ